MWLGRDRGRLAGLTPSSAAVTLGTDRQFPDDLSER